MPHSCTPVLSLLHATCTSSRWSVANVKMALARERWCLFGLKSWCKWHCFQSNMIVTACGHLADIICFLFFFNCCLPSIFFSIRICLQLGFAPKLKKIFPGLKNLFHLSSNRVVRRLLVTCYFVWAVPLSDLWSLPWWNGLFALQET